MIETDSWWTINFVFNGLMVHPLFSVINTLTTLLLVWQAANKDWQAVRIVGTIYGFLTPCVSLPLDARPWKCVMPKFMVVGPTVQTAGWGDRLSNGTVGNIMDVGGLLYQKYS